jgi:hypothetical protein
LAPFSSDLCWRGPDKFCFSSLFSHGPCWPFQTLMYDWFGQGVPPMLPPTPLQCLTWGSPCPIQGVVGCPNLIHYALVFLKCNGQNVSHSNPNRCFLFISNMSLAHSLWYT